MATHTDGRADPDAGSSMTGIEKRAIAAAVLVGISGICESVLDIIVPPAPEPIGDPGEGRLRYLGDNSKQEN